MKRIKGSGDHIIDAQIVDTWEHPDRVSLSRAELRSLQENQKGWRTLQVCGAALCVCVGLWVIGSMFKSEPAMLPRCESNCSVKQGWF